MSDSISTAAVVQINITSAEMSELCRCYRCDCTTYPICTWFGEGCSDCMDMTHLQHYSPNVNKPGEHLQSTTADTTPPQPPPELRPLVRTYIEEIKTQPNGDCLYEAIVHALNYYVRSAKDALITIEDLRSAAARKQTPDTFAAYQALAANQPEYRCISRSRTLRGFKNVIQRCGDVVGPEHCLWGDENTLEIFSRLFLFRFAVFNDKGKLVQQIEALRGVNHTVLLRLNRARPGEEHFSLLRFNGETILQAHEWNWLKNRLNIKST
jgi:hypothetical protein